MERRFSRSPSSTVSRKTPSCVPGQKLRLVPAAYADPDGEPQRIRYRVKRGDSLWEISRQFGVSDREPAPMESAFEE